MRGKIGAGLLAGLVSGLLLGVVLHPSNIQAATGAITPVMTAFGELIRQPNVGGGWIVHLLASLVAGAIFATVAGNKIYSMRKAVRWGTIYGVVSWVVAALVTLPLSVGLSVFEPITNRSYWDFAGFTLVAYSIAGAILGAVYRKMHTSVKVNKAPQRASVGV